MPGPRSLPLALLLTSACVASAESWPTLHKDYQRSGYTAEVVKGPHERKWFRDFHDELISTRCEGIVAAGKVFVGTNAGKLYALNVEDGSTAWSFQAAGPIGHSPCYGGARLYVASEGETFNRGYVYALNAADGKEQWRFAAGAGVWVSPACDGGKVYFGDRGGCFHAVRVEDGTEAWNIQAGGMILTPASFSPDRQRIVFAAEDLCVYCVDPAGKLLWKTPRLHGLSLRDHAPTIWQNLAIVRTNVAEPYHENLNASGGHLMEAQRRIPQGPGDKVLHDKWGKYVVKSTPARVAAERKATLEWLAKKPTDQTFYAFGLEDGKEPWVAQVLFAATGLHNPPGPPTFHPERGVLYTWYASMLGSYSAGVPAAVQMLGTLDPKTGCVTGVPHSGGEQFNAGAFAPPSDESQALSLMGDCVINTHQGVVIGMDPKTSRFVTFYSARDTYGGIFGPLRVGGWGKEGDAKRDEARAKGILLDMPNEWHGPDRAIVSIGEGRLFWVVGSQVVCLGGPDAPKTATGGTTAPPFIRRRSPEAVKGGNVAVGGGRFDEKLEKKVLTVADVKPLLEIPKGGGGAETALTGAVRKRLDAQVLELCDGGPWAHFLVLLGISGMERHFWRSATAMQTVALAMPHLSPEVRAKAKAWLEAQLRAGAPMKAPVVPVDGRRREPFEPGPAMLSRGQEPPTYRRSIEDLYALWACAHYADLWPAAQAQVDEAKAVAGEFLAKPVAFDHHDRGKDACRHLNAQIAGTIAYARLMRKAGQTEGVERALARLAELATERVHHERADTRFVRPSDATSGGIGSHHGGLPRYEELSPEVADLLERFCREALAKNVGDLTTQLKLWYQAYGERMIGGEDYISPPGLSRGLFAVLADGLKRKPEDLARYLDQPWCRADLYDIEKCAAFLRR